MRHPRHTVVCIGSLSPSLHLIALTLASKHGSELIVVPDHIANPPPPMDWMPKPLKWEVLTANATASKPDPVVDFEPLRKSRRQRSHPNEPFYRGLRRKKQRW